MTLVLILAKDKQLSGTDAKCGPIKHFKAEEPQTIRTSVKVQCTARCSILFSSTLRFKLSFPP